MIDKIRFSKKNLSELEINKIVVTSRLQSYDADGLKHYHNQRTKNFNGGMFIKIDIDKSLKIEGSLHKYGTFLKSKELNNFDSFTMHQAKETLLKLIENTGFEIDNVKVNFYEIGLNIVTNINPNDLLKSVYSIGNFDKEKIFYIDPKFKNQSQKITEYHKDFRLVHKIYDKIHEMRDNKKEPPKDKIIMRIETIHKRVEKTYLIDFFATANLKRVQRNFFDNWDKLNFLVEIVAPPKTSVSKIELAKILYKKKEVEVLKEIFEQYKNNTMSIKIYYTLKRFIENWENEKINFRPTKSIIFSHWEKLYNIDKQTYNEKTNL
ncbi:hypothetical protein K5L04_10390 [Flavobacterium psychrophilum]|uniref:hypothetical protein n=1 Tax=Flavobacterium psychrophilum TaxID=96345 RepID=UPI001C8F76AD|nr:hypothetical protein [Flavobacterium psychrophilum]QZL00101.1 hypothetical protein K5L04_10390 [Flavobacterium psychrophilum]